MYESRREPPLARPQFIRRLITHGAAAGASAALVLTPVLHRLLHRFHWNEKG